MSGRAALAHAGSARVVWALVGPVLAVGAACAAGRVGLAALAGSRTVPLWLALLAAALAASGATSLMAGRPARGLAALAAALVAAQGCASAALTLDATIEAGEGEQSPPATRAFAGRLATVPRVRALALPGPGAGAALLSTALREVTAPVGREVEVGPGLRARVEAVFAAPVFVVRHGDGNEETVGPVKLRPGVRQYFLTRALPHRFYVTTAAGGDPAAPLRLRVQRGKIDVLDRELRRGDALEFEGLSIAWTASAPWAPIRVRYAPRPWLAAGGGALAIAALAVAARRRGRA